MVEGVTNGYKKEPELVGVGFRAQASGQQLTLALGYSHPIIIEPSQGSEGDGRVLQAVPIRR